MHTNSLSHSRVHTLTCTPPQLVTCSPWAEVTPWAELPGLTPYTALGGGCLAPLTPFPTCPHRGDRSQGHNALPGTRQVLHAEWVLFHVLQNPKWMQFPRWRGLLSFLLASQQPQGTAPSSRAELRFCMVKGPDPRTEVCVQADPSGAWDPHLFVCLGLSGLLRGLGENG